jgi:hypothetical protein
MSDEGSGRAGPEPTKQEVNSKLMRGRLLRHVEDWYPGYRQKSPPDLSFVAAEGKLELWKCSVIPPAARDEQTTDMWLFWNTREVVSHSSSDNAFIDFVSELKNKRIEGRFQYCTSPLTVSAILAFLMLALIMGLLLSHGSVPDQLWSVFTAVVAFYFGRESGARSSEMGVRE